jgi:hypothetical protein
MGLGFEVSKARQNFEGWTSWKCEVRATRPGVDSFSIVQKCKQDREGGLKGDNGLVASNLSFDLGPVAFAGRQEGTGDLTLQLRASIRFCTAYCRFSSLLPFTYINILIAWVPNLRSDSFTCSHEAKTTLDRLGTSGFVPGSSLSSP